jgi:hypothetical protein
MLVGDAAAALSVIEPPAMMSSGLSPPPPPPQAASSENVRIRSTCLSIDIICIYMLRENNQKTL